MENSYNESSKHINILFLGAGKRVSLLERLQEDFERIGVKTKFYSIELYKDVPISYCAEVIAGPKFDNVYFQDFLIDVVKQKHINIVIPCMDSAVNALSLSKYILFNNFQCMALVSDSSVCNNFVDKIKAANIFRNNEINHPKTITRANISLAKYPLIAKPKNGYGARGQTIIDNFLGIDNFIDNDKYLLQEYVKCDTEYTVDCYISKNKKITSIVPRKRIEVIGGEVSRTEVIKNQKIIDYSEMILSKFNFFGAITIQMLDTEVPTVIEINCRFGGGVIASFIAGCKFGEWIYNDLICQENCRYDSWNYDFVMARANREFIFRKEHENYSRP